MPERGWRIRVEDILGAIKRIEHYTEGMNYEQFCQDQKTIDAVVRNLEIIGEASGYIPNSIQEGYSEIPWAKLRGIRNVIAHEYFGVSKSIIWQTIQVDLHPLATSLAQVTSQDETN